MRWGIRKSAEEMMDELKKRAEELKKTSKKGVKSVKSKLNSFVKKGKSAIKSRFKAIKLKKATKAISRGRTAVSKIAKATLIRSKGFSKKQRYGYVGQTKPWTRKSGGKSVRTNLSRYEFKKPEKDGSISTVWKKRSELDWNDELEVKNATSLGRSSSADAELKRKEKAVNSKPDGYDPTQNKYWTKKVDGKTVRRDDGARYAFVVTDEKGRKGTYWKNPDELTPEEQRQVLNSTSLGRTSAADAEKVRKNAEISRKADDAREKRKKKR